MSGMAVGKQGVDFFFVRRLCSSVVAGFSVAVLSYGYWEALWLEYPCFVGDDAKGSGFAPAWLHGKGVVEAQVRGEAIPARGDTS